MKTRNKGMFHLRRFAENHAGDLAKLRSSSGQPMSAKDFQEAYNVATPEMRQGMLDDIDEDEGPRERERPLDYPLPSGGEEPAEFSDDEAMVGKLRKDGRVAGQAALC
jgi:hypothetical protein